MLTVQHALFWWKTHSTAAALHAGIQKLENCRLKPKIYCYLNKVVFCQNLYTYTFKVSGLLNVTGLIVIKVFLTGLLFKEGTSGVCAGG